MQKYTAKKVYAVGDLHGLWQYLLLKMDDLINDSIIICVGDIGLGFEGRSLETFQKILNPILSEKNLRLIAIRGNHDNPSLFTLQSEHIHLIKETETIRINDKNYFFIGGALSLDRKYRIPSLTFWPDEAIDYNGYTAPTVPIDTLITHSAPSLCRPVGFNDYVRYFTSQDDTLEKELLFERQFLTDVFLNIKPKKLVHGHYHKSHKYLLEGCEVVSLDELEVREI